MDNFFEHDLDAMDLKNIWSGGVLGWDWVGRGREGLLNSHLIFQKTLAEPGNSS